MPAHVTLDELESIAEADLGATDWILVDQETVSTFARVTRDEQWIHVDPARAAAGPFGGTIAHGFLTLSLTACFFGELIDVSGCSMTINYGAERVRFPAPVPVGSRIRGRGRNLGATRQGDAVRLVTRIEVEVEGGAKPACVADLVTLFYP